MFRSGIMALTLAISVSLLAGCSHQEDKMQAQLDSIRTLVKQSALMAAQAVCSAPESRPDMIKASVTMLRRAMGGPEMEMIHKMMGQMPDSNNESTAMKPGMSGDMDHGNAAHMQMHVAIHDAGEDVFELLDALGGSKPPTCADVQAVQLAASAALMREWHGPDMQRIQQQLDKRSTHFISPKLPDTVQQLAQALGRI